MTERKSNIAPHLALVAVQIFFGTSTVLGKFALLTFPPNALVGFRVAGAALFFFIVQRFRGGMALDNGRDYVRFAIFGLIGITLNQLLFFKGLSLTSAVNTSLIAINIPIFTIALSAILGGEKLSLRRVGGIVLAAIGVIYLIDPTRASFGSESTVGDLLIVANSFCYALYMAIAKDTIARYGALKSIAWLFIFGSVVNVPVGIWSVQSVELTSVTSTAWIFVAGLVVFPTILAYYWNAWALSRVEPSIVAVYIYLQPLIGFITAAIFLGEHFSTRLLVAAALVFAGLYFATTKRRANVS